jgi:CheY-like chemotaxis protein
MPDLQTVLVVDDDDDIREVTQLALEGVGDLAVRTCSSGAEALEALTDYSPDLILLDVRMPDMDGPSFVDALRKRSTGSRLPVVFMTASVQVHELARYKEVGVIGVIAKPFDPLELAGRLRQLVEASERDDGAP